MSPRALAPKNPHAVALGRRGGAVSSPEKAAAARANGQKGGRPRKAVKTPSAAPRFAVRTVSANFRAVREPHQVVDTRTASVVDEYASKRAAAMHARELNRAERPAACPECERSNGPHFRGACSH